MESVPRRELGQGLDEVLLARRREDLRTQTHEFLPYGALV